MRFIKHFIAGPHSVRRVFPKGSFDRITSAIAASEKKHTGEIRFAVEPGLGLGDMARGKDPKTRALQVFSDLRIWDTEANNGVLIYLLLADRAVEIVGDRGLHAEVGDAGWQSICEKMQRHFREGEFETGVLEGIAAITSVLISQFPKTKKPDANELPDFPVIL